MEKLKQIRFVSHHMTQSENTNISAQYMTQSENTNINVFHSFEKEMAFLHMIKPLSRLWQWQSLLQQVLPTLTLRLKNDAQKTSRTKEGTNK